MRLKLVIDETKNPQRAIFEDEETGEAVENLNIIDLKIALGSYSEVCSSGKIKPFPKDAPKMHLTLDLKSLEVIVLKNPNKNRNFAFKELSALNHNEIKAFLKENKNRKKIKNKINKRLKANKN